MSMCICGGCDAYVDSDFDMDCFMPDDSVRCERCRELTAEEDAYREDEREASHAKYNCCRIVRLSSGNVAIFAPYSADDGIDLIYCGPLSGAENAILTAEQVDLAASKAHISEAGRLAGIMALVGAQAPPQTLGIVRRV